MVECYEGLEHYEDRRIGGEIEYNTSMIQSSSVIPIYNI